MFEMFREMRRKRQQLPPEECRAILWRGTSGVLAVSGDDGYPYAVPLSLSLIHISFIGILFANNGSFYILS